MTHAHRLRPLPQRGAAVHAIVFALFVLLIIILALYSYCAGVARAPGAKPMYIQIADTTLAPGVPTTIEIRMGLTHPLPTVRTPYTVRVDENDWFGDNTLQEPITLMFDPADKAHPYAFGTFTVVCTNLGANGEFDLEGATGKSTGESEHNVHAEETLWYGFSGDDAVIKCAIPTIAVGDDSGGGVAAPVYCLYKVDSAPGADAAHINNTICVRCVPPENSCPTQATLDLGEERKWQVTSEGPKCQTCPPKARAFEKR